MSDLDRGWFLRHGYHPSAGKRRAASAAQLAALASLLGQDQQVAQQGELAVAMRLNVARSEPPPVGEQRGTQSIAQAVRVIRCDIEPA